MKMRFASILLTLIGVLAMGAAAQAQSGSKTIVNLPFEFVAAGQTLPAGTYTLTPVSDYVFDGIILRSYENHVSVIVHPIEAVPRRPRGQVRGLRRISQNQPRH